MGKCTGWCIAGLRTQGLCSFLTACQRHAGDSMGGMMEAADGVHSIDLLNLQLGLVDRDFDESDYEVSSLTHAP